VRAKQPSHHLGTPCPRPLGSHRRTSAFRFQGLEFDRPGNFYRWSRYVRTMKGVRVPTKHQLIAALHLHGQRATYGAVAGIAGGLPRGLMATETRCHTNSWVVAGSTNLSDGRRKDWPTGYVESEIDPRLLKGAGLPTIRTSEGLRRWYANHSATE
jgi:hypothetical protein